MSTVFGADWFRGGLKPASPRIEVGAAGRLRIAMVIATGVMTLAGPAAAADITVQPATASRPALVVVSGEFDIDDGTRFAEATESLTRAVVVFDSPGGRLVAGLQIGQNIRLKHFGTAVLANTMCASACAFAWLAGQPRTMQPDARVGFHEAFVEQDGLKVPTGTGNALAGAYLDRLGLSYDAIIYIEQALPDDVTWLTPADARRLGIDLVLLPEQAEPPAELPSGPPAEPSPEPPAAPASIAPHVAPAPSPTRRAAMVLFPALVSPVRPQTVQPVTPQQRVRAFVDRYFAQWSASNAQALGFFAGAYADAVMFYGKTITRDTLIQAKQSFSLRWPVRVYGARPESTRVFCNQATGICAVSGIVDWDCHGSSGKSHSVGTANFAMTIRLSGLGEQIIGESGSVISRSAN